MKQCLLIGKLALAFFCATLFSCVGRLPRHEIALVDSLNLAAYNSLYKDIKLSRYNAETAYQNAIHYAQGKAEACNLLGLSYFLQMNFERAEKYFEETYEYTKNELELLIADIGMMKICQRKALNKEFYDYRIRATKRMKRIAEEQDLFKSQHEIRRLNYARSEYYIVSAIYYYYLQQRQEAITSLNEISKDITLQADTNQLLYYHYIKGSAALCEGETPDARRLREFDNLYLTWQQASQKGYIYFEGNGIQGLSNLMSVSEDFEFFRNRRSYALSQFGIPVDSLLPKRMGEIALLKFKCYDDSYQIAGAYVSIGKYLNAHGCYHEAIDTLTKALSYVDNENVEIVPECISRIREQLSVSYAGIGDKELSDYNRNVYLDILDETRQDKEFESRYQILKTENRQLNVLIATFALGFVSLLILLTFFNHYSKKRNKIHINRLQTLLGICQKIVSSTHAEVQTKEELEEIIQESIQNDLQALFGKGSIKIEKGELYFLHQASKEEQAIAHVILPYIQWALENTRVSASLKDECLRLEKQRYIYEQHIATNKRHNLEKKACIAIVNGIQPYIDRIINEVRKLERKDFHTDSQIKKEKITYIEELVSTINEYNEILALWIKMKQGSLSLNIENFPLDTLFCLIKKSNRAFQMKQLQLNVVETDAWVKADKALTLFMINTLAENARKYTPQGGIVSIEAIQENDYVEVSVSDTGYGLSPEDVARITGEKVYNSQEIGMKDTDNKEALRKNKGSGFGLMNCRGIIEKYRKTNPLFNVCTFGVESEQGKGSRFFFRLPTGVKKTIAILLLMFSFSHTNLVASEVTDVQEEYERLLNIASDYADNAYYSNIDGNYQLALQYIDSAIVCLNQHYQQYASDARHFMSLTDNEEPAELFWWHSMFDSDFHVILDIRNEAAVAFLALKKWKAYTYNNTAYTTLYKLLGEDQSLEEYCQQLERSTNNKTVSILLVSILSFFFLLSYYFLYYRKRLTICWNLEQVFEINRTMFTASQTSLTEDKDIPQCEEDTLHIIPQQMVEETYNSINDLISIKRLNIAFFNNTTCRLETASNPPMENESKESYQTNLLIERCYQMRKHVSDAGIEAYPLEVNNGEQNKCVGVICIERTVHVEQENEHLLLELIARYMAIVIYNSVIKLANKYRDIDAAQDETRRASWEDSQLHVQNLVLDNCLSTIKHETVYYPTKIKLLVEKLQANNLSPQEEKETICSIGELIDYYKGIFSILSRCAERQLEEICFRRTRIKVSDLFQYADKYLRKTNKCSTSHLTLKSNPIDAYIIGDFDLLKFLLENLINESLAYKADGELLLTAERENDYIRFYYIDKRRNKNQDELNRLFYPDLSRMSIGSKGSLQGIEYLLCKQIIRDHDEYTGNRGCHINAKSLAEGGFAVYFTLFSKENL